MNTQQALEVIRQASAAAKMSLQEHQMVQQAIQLLEQELSKKDRDV